MSLAEDWLRGKGLRSLGSEGGGESRPYGRRKNRGAFGIVTAGEARLAEEKAAARRRTPYGAGRICGSRRRIDLGLVIQVED